MQDDDSDPRGNPTTSPTKTTDRDSVGGPRIGPGTVLAGRYEIRELLGRGGMGEVWRAHDRKLEIDVALKALRREFYGSERRRELLRREVKAARGVVSQNVCRVFDLVIEGELELLSMELVEGRTLGSVLQERGPLEHGEAARIAEGFLAGLQAVHDAGLVHRDFKPDNVMITASGRVVVMDFGIARGADAASATVAGTPAYMAPEQTLGRADARSDVFSAGVVLAEMVSPEGPLDPDSRERLWEGIRSEPPRVPPGPLGPIARRAVSSHPSDRFPTARSMARALAGTVEGRPSGASGRRIGRPAVAVSLVAVLGALATLGRELFTDRGSVDPSASASAIASIVALPATVHAADAEAYLADAIPSTLSSHLSRVPGLDTKLPPSSDDLARVGGDLDTVARAYGVDGVVISRITAQGPILILDLQLVRPASRSVLWSGEYRVSPETYLGMLRRAAGELTARLRPQAVGGGSSRAELALRKGIFHADRYHNAERSPDFELARESLQRALEIEPGRAEAAAHMAWLLIYR